MPDPLDVDLQDDDLVAEILLLTDLMVSASPSEGPLSQSVIDTVLGVSVAGDPTDPPAPATRSASPDPAIPTAGDTHRRAPPPTVPRPRTPEAHEQHARPALNRVRGRADPVPGSSARP